MPADGMYLTAALYTPLPPKAWERLHNVYRPWSLQDVWSIPPGERGRRARVIRAERAAARRLVRRSQKLPLLLSIS